MNIESPFFSLFTKLQAEHYFNIKTALIIKGLALIIINKPVNYSIIINRLKTTLQAILNYTTKIYSNMKMK